jgi:cysteine desulfurase
MEPYFREQYFNPSSMYGEAQAVAEALKSARQKIARFFGGVGISEILFTSCATESNNAAIFGVVRATRGRRHIITTEVEHPAVLEVCKELAREGFDVTYLPVDRQGNLSITDFISSIRSDTLLVSIMHANNETGVVFPIEEHSRIAKETSPELLIHTDATQTVGKIPITLKTELSSVDLLSFSGHKIHAPKGVGALFIRRGTPCRPYLIGGHQEEGRRGGTENVPYVVGLAAACELAARHFGEEGNVALLRDLLEEGISCQIPYIEINGAGARRLPNTLNLACHFIEGESILFQLSSEHICASSGSACTSGSLEPSHVLRAMAVPFTAMHGSVRFSLSRYTTKEEVEKVLEVFPAIVCNLRKISPYWDSKANCPRTDVTIG